MYDAFILSLNLILSIVVCLGGVAYPLQIDKASDPRNAKAQKAPQVGRYVIPNYAVRHLVQNLTTRDVSFLRIYGDDFGYDGKEYALDVYDPQLIHGFLSALKHSYIISGPIPMNIRETLEIHCRKQNNKARERMPSLVSFLPNSPYDLGTEFNAMMAKLEKYEANKARQMKPPTAAQVKYIEISGPYASKMISISNHDEIQRTLETLKNVDTNEFAFTNPGTPCWMDLYLNNGKQIHQTFVLKYYPKEKLRGAPLLPYPFWDFYLDSMKGAGQ